MTEAIETEVGIWIVVAAVAAGVAVTYLLNYLIDQKTNPELPHIDESHPKTADDLDELIHSDHYQHHQGDKGNRLGLFVAGIVMACAIALHNVPEGMTIGASYASNDAVCGVWRDPASVDFDVSQQAAGFFRHRWHFSRFAGDFCVTQA